MGRPLIYLDANVVIRLVEGDAATLAPLAARLAPSLGVPGSLLTSRLTRLECRSKPLRAADAATLSQYDVFFAGAELLLAEVSPAVIERATGRWHGAQRSWSRSSEPKSHSPATLPTRRLTRQRRATGGSLRRPRVALR